MTEAKEFPTVPDLRRDALHRHLGRTLHSEFDNSHKAISEQFLHLLQVLYQNKFLSASDVKVIVSGPLL